MKRLLTTDQLTKDELHGELILVVDPRAISFKEMAPEVKTGDILMYNKQSNTVIHKCKILSVRSLGKQIVLKSEAEQVLKGMFFCFTGPADLPRPAMHSIVKMFGGDITSGVTKETTYLVMENLKSQSTKAQKARSYGTKCINLAQFYELIEKI